MSLTTKQEHAGRTTTFTAYKKLRAGEWVTHLQITEDDSRVTRLNLTPETTKQLAEQLGTIAREIG